MGRSMTSVTDEITVSILSLSVIKRSFSIFLLSLFGLQAQLELLGVTYLCPKEGLSEESLKSYLQTPPTGKYYAIYIYLYI